MVAPVFSGEREIKWTDFNDHVAEGLEAVRRQVLAVVETLQRVVGKISSPALKTAP